MTARTLSVRVNAEHFFDGPFPYYNNLSKPRGLALVINNFNFDGDKNRSRIGSENDFSDSIALLKGLGFRIKTYWDLTAQEMHTAVNSFAKSLEKQDYQSCVVILMTHGVSGHFLGVDETLLKESDFMKPIVRSKKLRDMPKIFFIQACRNGPTDPTFHPTYPSGHETFIFHSTMPGCKSYRTRLGSLFMQTVCKIIGQDAHESWADIQRLKVRICQTVDEEGDGNMQEPNLIVNATKKFHFFPIETVFI